MIAWMEPVKPIVVAAQDAGLRLDVLLARELGVSRGFARKLLGRERILLDGRSAAKGAILRAGDVIEVQPFRRPEQGPLAWPEGPFRLLASGQGLLAIDKPAGVPSHPLDPEERETALGAVLARHPEVADAGEAGSLERGLVHRLDTGTSGVLVFATAPAAWRDAREAFARRRVHKRYLARVHGRYAGPEHVAPRLEGRGARVRVVTRGGLEAPTWLRVLAYDGATTLLEVHPVTGVRHQIRAVLGWLGHPIVGDATYGSEVVLGRHLLHAASIRFAGLGKGFEGIGKGGDFSAEAPPPPELEVTPGRA